MKAKVAVAWRGRVIISFAALFLTVVLTCSLMLLAVGERKWRKPLRSRSRAYQVAASMGNFPMTPERWERYARQLTGARQAPIQEINLSNSPAEERDARYSPGGEEIAFASNGLDTNGDGRIDSTGPDFNIWVMRRDGSWARMVTIDAQGQPEPKNQVQPTWSPGGQEIAYISDETGTPEIFIINLTAKTKRLLSIFDVNGEPITGPKRDPFWASNGEIFFVGSFRGNVDIFKVPPTGKGAIRLTTDPGEDSSPAVSPAADLIAFVSNRLTPNNPNKKKRIFVMNADGTGQQQITTYPDLPGRPIDDIDPAWHPSIAQVGATTPLEIAFSSNRPFPQEEPAQDRSRDFNIFLLDVGRPPTLTPEDPPVTVGGGGTNPARLLTNKDLADRGNDTQPYYHPIQVHFPHIAFISNRTTNPDIWQVTVQDITPPFLEFSMMLGLEKSGRPIIQPRLAAPGAPVKVRAVISDQESGLRSMVARFYDPDSAIDDSEGIERKRFVKFIENTDCAPIVVWIEIQPDEPEPEELREALERLLLMEIDPPVGFVGEVELRIFDDGPPPRGNELQANAKANDQIYYCEGEFQTPTSPSDYLMFLQVGDNAGNDFVYDNIWGFSTQPFIVSNNLLFVADYMNGQRFLANSFMYRFKEELGDFLLLPPIITRFWGASTPTESYYTWNEGGGLLADSDTLRGESWFFEAEAMPDPGRDIWRVQCRGPIPPEVVFAYLPRSEIQLDPADPEFKQTRVVPVAERCVIWASPYTGNLLAGPGTLFDPAIQSLLSQFLDKGGRLFVSGMDVAWALTLNGTVKNPFLTNYLKADFGGEPFLPLTEYQVQVNPIIGGWAVVRPDPRAVNLDIAEVPGDPLVGEPGVGSWSHGHNPVEVKTPWHSPSPDPPTYADAAHLIRFPQLSFTNGFYIQPFSLREALNCYLADVLIPQQGAIPFYRYTEGLPAGRDVAAVRYENAATGSRVVFMGFGLEAVHRHYHDTPCHCMNKRSHLLHNIICWMRTGQIIGKVMDNEGKPLPGALVEILQPPSAAGRVTNAMLTLADGTFIINGIPPGRYGVRASKPGYFAHERIDPPGVPVHGGMRQPLAAAVNFRLIPAPPGSISGKVTQIDGVTPVPGAAVQAESVLPGPDGKPITKKTTTDTEGRYSISDLPSGKYTVTASAPPKFGSDVEVVDVTPGVDTPDVDLALPGLPGKVEGRVVDADTGVGIEGALVEAFMGGAKLTVDGQPAEATTGAGGTFSFSVPAGRVELRASKAGYLTGSVTVTVVSGETTTGVEIRLRKVAPGSISGRVVRLVDGTPVADVTIEVVDGAGNVIALGISDPQFTVEGEVRFNYRILDVPPGTYTVRAVKSGFTADPRTNVTVSTGVETRNVDFFLRALRTFRPGLSMVSFPFDYRPERLGADDVLGIENPKLATWVADINRADGGQYVFFPIPPADAFEVGRGYFFFTQTTLDFTKEGGPVFSGQPFPINLEAGWNLIGAPFNFNVDWFKSMVRRRDQPEEPIPIRQAAIQTPPIMKDVLFTLGVGNSYRPSSILQPFTGYWVRAFFPVELQIDNNPVRGIDLTPQPHPLLRQAQAQDGKGKERGAPLYMLGKGLGRGWRSGSSNWFISLIAESGEAKDDFNVMGASQEAADGYDPYDVPTPPPPRMVDYVDFSFPHRDWGLNSGNYAVDIRALGGQSKVWEVVVESNTQRPVTIRWNDLVRLPRHLRAVLIDSESGQQRYMRTTSSYTFEPEDNKDNPVRRLRIVVTSQAASPLRIVRVRQLPSRGGTVAVGFTLTEAAELTVKIKTLVGKVIRVVTTNSPTRAGDNIITWDGRGGGGTVLVPGRYLMELIATRPEDLASVRAVVGVTVR